MWRFGLLVMLAGCIEFEIEKVQDEPVDGILELVADPELVDFGTLTSLAPVAQTVTVTSVGDSPVTVTGMDLSGSTAYALTWASVETVLEPGDSLDVVVTYTPASFEDEGQLLVRSDIVGPSLAVPVLGAGTYPAIAVSPSSVSFLSEYGESVDEEVVVTSVGTADLVISDMFVEGSTWFAAEGAVPITLAPGESTTLDVTYTPSEPGENVSGKIWLTTNTAEGFAIVPLDAMYGAPCIGMGEAWDRDLMGARTLFDGNTLEVENYSTDEEICVDRWYVYLAYESQDLGAGDMSADFGDAYPAGSITIAPSSTQNFLSAESSGASWWCMEETQYTDRTKEYEFIGAYVPEPLLSYMLDADQDAVWNWMDDNPVIIAARGTNYVELSPGGGSATVGMRVFNMGSWGASTEVRESVPAGWTATDFSLAPDRTEAGAEGATVYVWDVTLTGRDQGGPYDHTVYDEREISYTLTVPACFGRQYAASMSTSWVDNDGVSRMATANPLVVNCHE